MVAGSSPAEGARSVVARTSRWCGTLVDMRNHTYRCGICGQTSQHPADDDTPVCNNSAHCGLLFEDEIVKPEVPTKRSIKFSLIGEGHVEGDDREYEVIVQGRYIGTVAAEQRPAVHKANEDHFIDGFAFGGDADGVRRYGWGRTRAEAVIDAFS